MTYLWVVRCVSWRGTGDCRTCRVCPVDTARLGCGRPCGGSPRWSACNCRRSVPRGSESQWPSCRPEPIRAGPVDDSSRRVRSLPATRAVVPALASRLGAERTNWTSQSWHDTLSSCFFSPSVQWSPYTEGELSGVAITTPIVMNL